MVSKTTSDAHHVLSKLATVTSTVDVQEALTTKTPSVAATPHATSTTEPAKNVQPPSPFEQQSLTNLCSASSGAQVLFATDEWFASANCLLQDGPPIFVDDLFCEQGKVMDGWETRRRREAGHDWCIIKLVHRAEIVGIEIDTAHFTGNNAPSISLEMADLDSHEESIMVGGIPGVVERILHGGDQGVGHSPEEVHEAEESSRRVVWNELLPMTPLRPGYEPTRMHYFSVIPKKGTHLRVNYWPDGGVARLRLWGTPIEAANKIKKPLYAPISTGRICTVVSHKDTTLPPSQQFYEYPELSSCEHGGEGVECSNKHYGHPRNLIQPTLGKDMGDGWETARHPERPAILKRHPTTHLVDSDLKDWAIIKLGQVAPNGIARIILDTKHFRGNYPESVCVEGCFCERGSNVCEYDRDWFSLVKRTRMAPDAEHVFERTLQQIDNATRAVTHVRVTMYPDGGLSRVRIYGEPLSQDSDGMLSQL